MSRPIKFRAWSPSRKMWVDTGITVGRQSIGEVFARQDGIVSQFIGLKDKNGVEIYEGDVIYYQQNVYKVVYSEHKACYSLEGVCRYMDIMAFAVQGQLTSIYSEKYFEVIGNIYQNPEMLENQFWLDLIEKKNHEQKV